MDVTPTHVVDLIEIPKHLDFGNRQDFKTAARTILVRHHEHLVLFNLVFDAFWQPLSNRLPPHDLGQLLQKSPHIKKQASTTVHLNKDEPSSSDKAPDGETKIQTYSAKEILHQKDFSQLSPTEREEVKSLIQEMTWRLDQRPTRRKAPSCRGTHLDMRRTLRHNLRYGAEPLVLKWRNAKMKKRPLVIICDISGSMEPYSRLLLQFLYVVNQGLHQVEAFVFGTSLTRITHHLKTKDVDQALAEVSSLVRDWAGGTRIGETLKVFNYIWAKRVLGQGAIVLMISDGWDRGDSELLGREMGRLQRSCHRLIWLNPLLGSPRYEPLTRGMQSALPHVDDFLPVHNLASLQQLADLLGELEKRGTSKRQFTLVT